MLTAFQEALDRVLSHIQPLGSEKVSLLEALGRVIAEDIFATRDLPPYDNSGMDGYAVKYADIQNASKSRPIRLKVIGDLPAGSASTKIIEQGQAIRIMTGAPIPMGADTVIPVEETEEKEGFVSIFREVPLGEYIRRAGEDVKKGVRVFSTGDVISPAGVGMLASLGRSSVSVYQRPLAAILCTGNELVDVDGELDEVKIVSSNSYSLAAQVKECGAIPVQLGIAKDRREEIIEGLHQGIRADVLISSAGVSAGDFDYVKGALSELGMELIFWRVAMKPGKPLAFGTINKKPVFGLPGNPVSSMVSFEQFVRPSLLKMMGHREPFRPVIEATLKGVIHKESGSRHFIRALVSLEGNQYTVAPAGAQGSGILRSMVKANGLIVVPEDREIVKAGERVKVQLIDRVQSLDQ
jgi:molybdopterin molybdotransferase